jgi:lysozyme
MNISERGLSLIQQSESLRLTAYSDSKGVPTLGWGHTSGVRLGMTCTREQADMWLESDVSWAVATVNRLATVLLNQNQFDALVDFVFNVGSGQLGGSTLLRKLNSGDFEGAAQQFKVWKYAGGIAVPGLVNRRSAEEKMFRGL